MREIEAREMRDADAVIQPLILCVRNAEDFCRGAALGVEMAFHRRNLGRLVLVGIDAVEIADGHLCGADDRRHPHRHRQHHPRARIIDVAQEVECADGADGKSGRQISRGDGVRQAERE